MKKTGKILSMIMAVLYFGILSVSALAADSYGSAAVEENTDYTLNEMLNYAIQDEYLAHSEYQVIIETFGSVRPYANIINAEETHINELKALFETYGVGVTADNSTDYTTVPVSLTEAAKIGVTAETNNIAMYEKFLKQDLPDDVKAVFTSLKKASESHLTAFQRNVDRYAGTVTGNNNRSKNTNGNKTANGNGSINGNLRGNAQNGLTICDGNCVVSGSQGTFSGTGAGNVGKNRGANQGMSGSRNCGQSGGSQNRVKNGSCV